MNKLYAHYIAWKYSERENLFYTKAVHLKLLCHKIYKLLSYFNRQFTECCLFLYIYLYI